MNSRISQFHTLALYGLILGLTILAALTLRENRRLESKLYSVSATAAGGLKTGHLLPQLEVQDLDGDDFLIRYGPEAESWVLIFSTTCQACTDNLGGWKDLYREGRDRYEFVAISIDPEAQTREYAAQHELPFRVMTPKEALFFDQMYGVESVPLTIRVGPDGRVLESIPGVLPPGFVSRALSRTSG